MTHNGQGFAMKLLFTLLFVKVILTERAVFDSYKNMSDPEDCPNVCNDYESEACATEWAIAVRPIKKRNKNRLTNIQYQYESNINIENEKIKTVFEEKILHLNQKTKSKLRKFKWQNFKAPELRRIFQILSPTIRSKEPSVSTKIVNISKQIRNIYKNSKPCFGYCLKTGEKEIIKLFKKERNYDLLRGFWSSWRNETGHKIKNIFLDRMNLENIGAKENGHVDAASFQLKNDFEENKFDETVLNLYEEILPLYKQLHGFVRYCLSKFYPGKFNATGPIPAHILGDVWAQEWQNILPILQKCVDKQNFHDIKDMVNKKLESMSVKKMFEISEEFYTSIGMYPMTPNFWERSVLTKQSQRLMSCKGSAFNFYNDFDFRILMCTKPDIDNFIRIYSELGKIEYFMSYKNQIPLFNRAANPGFPDAVGGAIVLSVQTHNYLKQIANLIPKSPTADMDMNNLFRTALEKVALIPFSLSVSSYVWNIYSGSVHYNKMNEHWWDLRYRFQGITPPVKRTEKDFDPAAQYDIASGESTIQHLVSVFLQFQFYEAMCKLSGHTGPLHHCNFYGSKVAGTSLLKMLKKGNSQHWRKSLEMLVGSQEISSKPLIRYFQPLYEWLKNFNEKVNIPIGW